MSYQEVKTFRQKQKEKIIYVMGGKCAYCGYDKCSSALDIHHLDPKQKEFNISQNTNKAWNKIIIELPKTILLCANCHREVHAGLIDNNKLISPNSLKKSILINFSISVLFAKLLVNISNNKSLKHEYSLSLKV